MSEKLYNYYLDFAEEKLSKFQKEFSERYIIKLDPSQKKKFLISLLSRPHSIVEFKHLKGEKKLSLIKISPNKEQSFIIAFEANEQITNEFEASESFLTFLRNEFNRLENKEFKRSSLIVITSGDLDSISSGFTLLNSTNGPLAIEDFIYYIKQKGRKSKNIKNEWKLTALKIYEENLRNDLEVIEIENCEPLLSLFDENYSEIDFCRAIGIFTDSQIETLNGEALKERIEQNMTDYRIVASGYQSIDIWNDKNISKRFEANSIYEDVISKVNRDNLHEIEYKEILKNISKNEQETFRLTDIQIHESTDYAFVESLKERSYVVFRKNDSDPNQIKFSVTFNQTVTPSLFNITASPEVSDIVKRNSSDKTKLTFTIPFKQGFQKISIGPNKDTKLKKTHQIQFYISNLPSFSFSNGFFRNLKINQRKLIVTAEEKFSIGNPGHDEIEYTDQVEIFVEKERVFFDIASIEEPKLNLLIKEEDLAIEVKLSDSIKPVISTLHDLIHSSLKGDFYQIELNDTPKILSFQKGSSNPGEELRRYFKGLDTYINTKIKNDIANLKLHGALNTVILNYEEILKTLGQAGNNSMILPSLNLSSNDFRMTLLRFRENVSELGNNFDDFHGKEPIPDYIVDFLNLGVFPTEHNSSECYVSEISPLALIYQSLIIKDLDFENDDLPDLSIIHQLELSSSFPFFKLRFKSDTQGVPLTPTSFSPFVSMTSLKTVERTTRKDVSQNIIFSRINDYIKIYGDIFEVNEEMPLRIGIHSMGDCSDVVYSTLKLYLDFFTKEKKPPKILFNIFSDEHTKFKVSELEELYHSNTKKYDEIFKNIDETEKKEIINSYIKNVSFYKVPEVNGINWNHISFINLVGSSNKLNRYPAKSAETGLFFAGLFGGSTFTNDKGTFRRGFSSRGIEQDYNIKLLSQINALIAFAGENEYYKSDEVYSCVYVGVHLKTIQSQVENSHWVTLMEPPFDLRYLSQINNSIVLHYSDQLSSSTSYDAITISDKREQYEKIFRHYLNIVESTGRIGTAVNGFNSLNGEWLLKLPTTREVIVREKLSVFACSVIFNHLLNKFEHTEKQTRFWIPISIEELVRVSGALGLEKKFSPLSPKHKTGYFSDDLLFIGLKENVQEETLLFSFIPCEVKAGKVDLSKKASEQVTSTYSFFKDIFTNHTYINEFLRRYLLNHILKSVRKYAYFNSYALSTVSISQIEETLIKYFSFEDIRKIRFEDLSLGLVCSFKSENIIARNVSLSNRALEDGDSFKIINTELYLNDTDSIISHSLLETIRADIGPDILSNLVQKSSQHPKGMVEIENINSVLTENIEKNAASTFPSTISPSPSLPQTSNLGTNFSQDKHTFAFNSFTIEDRKNLYKKVLTKLIALKVKIDGVSVDDYDFTHDFIEGPSFYKFKIFIDERAQIKDLQKHIEDINFTLELPRGSQVRIYQDLGSIWLEAPKQDSKKSRVTTTALWHIFEEELKEDETV